MFLTRNFGGAVALALLSSCAASAGTIGTISACYACAANYIAHTFAPGMDLSDGVGFAFTNSSATDITGGVFQIQAGGGNATADSLNVGTIAAGSTIYISPGLTSDGQAGHTFFAVTGSALDTSDSGPSGDNTPFLFSGFWGGVAVSTGVFTPQATAGLSNDGLVADLNFLGGPNGDGCNDCFGPHIIANISAPDSNTPEPSGMILVLSGLGGIVALRQGRRRRTSSTQPD